MLVDFCKQANACSYDAISGGVMPTGIAGTASCSSRNAERKRAFVDFEKIRRTFSSVVPQFRLKLF